MQLTIEEANKIIKLLGEHEIAMAELYQIFSQQFPDSDFWSHLVKEERIHFQWINSLVKQVDIHNLDVNSNIFNPTAISNSIAYLEKIKSNADDYSLNKALGVSLDIEKAMIEQRYFEFYEGKNPAINTVLADLSNATKEHIASIEGEIISTQAQQENKIE